ncbi:MAG: hypothetical protein ACR2NP_15545 [Pirellulaceae bacterium]
MSEVGFLTVVHGMVFGSVFLLGFSAGLVALYSLRTAWTTPEGRLVRARRLPTYTWIMAASLWFTVLSGTFMVYPTYRAPAPGGTTELEDYPREYLLADSDRAFWHTFGMEWKEHVAWLAPILATAAAFVIALYRDQLADDIPVRRMATLLLCFAFVAAGTAGLLGALVNKAAPIP